MLRVPLALSFALASCTATSAFAQAAAQDYTHTIARLGNVELINHHPDCNPFAMAFDPVTPSGWGWRMPRIGWHAMYPVLNTGIKAGTRKTLEIAHVPSKIAAPIAFTVAAVALPILPHLRQASLGLKHGPVYQLNLYDWFYDFWNRNLVNVADDFTSWRGAAMWAAIDVPLSCFARP